MKTFLLGTPLLLLLVHGLIGGFTFLHWLFIVLLGAALIAPLFGKDKEAARVEAFNEYSAALQNLQNAGGLLVSASTQERRKRYEELKRKVDESHRKLMDRGGFTSI